MREWERDRRLEALDAVDGARKHGLTQEGAAARLGVSSRTLRNWETRRREGGLKATPRGRRPVRSPLEIRQKICAFIKKKGPWVGLVRLRRAVPEAPKGELRDFLRRARRVWRARKDPTYRLIWKEPGSVWAMDFKEPSVRIDGRCRYLLSVRDLAGHFRLQDMPVPSKDSAEVVRVLVWLFLRYGAPLVLKSDNESSFRDEVVRALLVQWRVLLLLSPVRTPSYNGSIEASHRGLDETCDYIAERDGHPGSLEAGDVAEATRLCNTTACPWGWKGPTPDERWEDREPITEELRAAFEASYVRLVPAVREELELPKGKLDWRTEALVDRISISRALVAHGLLLYRRRRITLRFRAQ